MLGKNQMEIKWHQFCLYGLCSIYSWRKRNSFIDNGKRNGKTKKNRNYDPEFARIIEALEQSSYTFTFTDDGSGLGKEILGQVTPEGNGNNFNVVVPDHSGTSKSDNQKLFGGRGAILAEETYHAYQISEGFIKTGSGGKGFVKGTGTIAAAEVDAKIWAAARPMTNGSVTMEGASVPTIAGIIHQQRGDRTKVLNFITKGTVRAIQNLTGGEIKVTYPPSYKF
ncbi:MAG: hypothetical protein MI974_11910 [Chitinophagales bacterium]|nr:hypothetical protein [Chitinophagales bacterium]